MLATKANMLVNYDIPQKSSVIVSAPEKWLSLIQNKQINIPDTLERCG